MPSRAATLNSNGRSTYLLFSLYSARIRTRAHEWCCSREECARRVPAWSSTTNWRTWFARITTLKRTTPDTWRRPQKWHVTQMLLQQAEHLSQPVFAVFSTTKDWRTELRRMVTWLMCTLALSTKLDCWKWNILLITLGECIPNTAIEYKYTCSFFLNLNLSFVNSLWKVFFDEEVKIFSLNLMWKLPILTENLCYFYVNLRWKVPSVTNNWSLL